MSDLILTCRGGDVVLPSRDALLVDRGDGGHLIVNPPRAVWERSELTPDELAGWSMVVAAAGRAMLDALPQLEGGCINYWEAGNWALHDEAPPPGPKVAARHRRVHQHLLGRSRGAAAAWRWGEAPRFPSFAERHDWASRCARLSEDECRAIVLRLRALLVDQYRLLD